MRTWKCTSRPFSKRSHPAGSMQCNAAIRQGSVFISCLFLVFVLNVCVASLAQQSSAKPSADFAEATSLVQQGRVAEAKTATLEALKHHPSSVEGYNLLGIIETNQHD